MGNPFDDAWRLLKMAAVMPDLTNPNLQRMASDFPLEALQSMLDRDPAINLNLDEKGNPIGGDFFGVPSIGMRGSEATRNVRVPNTNRTVPVPDKPAYLISQFDRSLDPRTLMMLREAGISAHPEILDDGRAMEYAFSMMPNTTRQMIERYAFGPNKDAFMGRDEITTGMDIDRLVNAHGQKFGPNERMVPGSAMEYQTKFPLNSAEMQAAAVMDRDRRLAATKNEGMENKTQAEMRREQMTGPDAERRAREAAETERLIALDRQNESDELFIPKKKEAEPYTGETQMLRDKATKEKPKYVRVGKKNNRRNIKPQARGRKK
jgi:hypothetical protein